MPKGTYKHKPQQGFQKGHKLFMNPENLKGRRLSPKTEFKKGFIPWNKGKKGVMPAPWNKGKHTGIKPWLGKKRPDMVGRFLGDKHPNWKGGFYDKEEEAIRHSPAYREWRKNVFQRDDHTCQACGIRGGELQADHVLSFAEYPDLRLEVLNGRTLCIPCHKKTPSYGKNTTGAYKKWLSPTSRMRALKVV